MAAPQVRPKRGTPAAGSRTPRPQLPRRSLAYGSDPLDGTLLLTSREVATFLNVPLRTLSDWRYKGLHLRYYTVGNSVRYDAAEVTALLYRNLHDAVDATLTERERAALDRRLAEVLAEIRAQGITDMDGIAAFLQRGGMGGLDADADAAEQAQESRLDG
jgi:hypothetical protein